jgi:hypothetical protein
VTDAGNLPVLLGAATMMSLIRVTMNCTSGKGSIASLPRAMSSKRETKSKSRRETRAASEMASSAVYTVH